MTQHITPAGFETATREATATRAIRPLGARVLVLPELEAATSKGGIHIPDNARKRECRGTVLAVGEGVSRRCCRGTVARAVEAIRRMPTYGHQFTVREEIIRMLESDEFQPPDTPPSVKVGDRVLFTSYAGKYAGTSLVLEDGSIALVMPEDDIIGVEER